jgi:hypothetical protein
MQTTIIIDDDTPILVELKPRQGERDVARGDNLINTSTEAISNAMMTIYGMSRRVVRTVNAIPVIDRPDAVEVEFGLKLTTDANAFVVNAGVEAQVNVKLTWDTRNKNS